MKMKQTVEFNEKEERQLEVKMKAIIAEYNALRQEIGRRSTDQLICVTGSVTAVGALLSVIASNPPQFTGLLIVIPWVLSIFGIIWCDHAHGLHLVAQYIREEIEQTKLPSLFSEKKEVTMLSTIGWESKLHDKRNENHMLGVINPVLPIIYFFVPSCISIFGYFLLRFKGIASLPKEIEYVFLVLGGLLLIALILFWFRLKKIA